MTKRMLLPVAVVALVGAGVLYAHRNAPPSCRNQETLARVSSILRDKFHLDSVFMNDITTVSNGFFGNRYECTAQVAEIKGNVSASSMPWRQVLYRIVSRGSYAGPAITVELGGEEPLAPPEKPFWARLFAQF